MLLRRHRRMVPVLKKPEPFLTENRAPVVEEELQVEETEVKLTRTDISRMNKAELIEQAESVGIDATDKSGTALKELLIEYYDL